jgi:hypothetical protein
VSRYTATIHMAEPHAATQSVACDGVYVDGGGNLYVQVTCHGDVETVARFQHGHWASYALELTDGPDVDAWLREGVMTREQFLGRAQGTFVDDSASEPVEAEPLPEVGETVHLWRENAPCTVALVKGHLPADGDIIPAGLILGRADERLLDCSWPRYSRFLTRTHDETRTESGSWHWPHDDGGQDAEPEPKPPAPSITINVSGSVLSERDLRDAIQQQLMRLAQLNPTLYRR